SSMTSFAPSTTQLCDTKISKSSATCSTRCANGQKSTLVAMSLTAFCPLSPSRRARTMCSANLLPRPAAAAAAAAATPMAPLTPSANSATAKSRALSGPKSRRATSIPCRATTAINLPITCPTRLLRRVARCLLHHHRTPRRAPPVKQPRTWTKATPSRRARRPDTMRPHHRDSTIRATDSNTAVAVRDTALLSRNQAMGLLLQDNGDRLNLRTGMAAATHRRVKGNTLPIRDSSLRGGISTLGMDRGAI
ncbi:hypothetical protein E4U54_004062, partial [Claviceps lovelessii]